MPLASCILPIKFRFVHDTFEALLDKENVSFQSLLVNKDYLFVIRHVQADYLAPLHMGDKITVSLWISKVGESSFVCEYEIHKDNQLVGTAQTVHVCIDHKTQQKRSLPTNIKQKLRNYLL